MSNFGTRQSGFFGGSTSGGGGGGVTSVGGTSPIASSGGTTPNISISQANGSTNGFLSSTDWTTFNGKVTSVGGTSPIASSGGTTPSISIPQANGSTNGYLSSTDWTTFSNNIVLATYQALGSTFKSSSPVVPTITMMTGGGLLADGSVRFIATYVPITATITGVKFFQVAQGDYTADNYNGIGLYSYNGVNGTLTLVASTTNDGNIWKGANSNWQTKAFTTPYSATSGLYFVGLLVNWSVFNATPSIGSSVSSTAGLGASDFTNSAKLVSFVNGQASLPITQLMSGTTLSNINYGVWLY